MGFITCGQTILIEWFMRNFRLILQCVSKEGGQILKKHATKWNELIDTTEFKNIVTCSYQSENWCVKVVCMTSLLKLCLCITDTYTIKHSLKQNMKKIMS